MGDLIIKAVQKENYSIILGQSSSYMPGNLNFLSIKKHTKNFRILGIWLEHYQQLAPFIVKVFTVLLQDFLA